jgi:hypothetical protein
MYACVRSATRSTVANVVAGRESCAERDIRRSPRHRIARSARRSGALDAKPRPLVGGGD